MKGVISIFVMPQELEDLALILNNLKRNSVYLEQNVTFVADITMCLSDELTDWDKSLLPKEYIKERTEELCNTYLDWCKVNLLFPTGKDILGCVSQRRYSLSNNPDCDFFIWLDCDMVFNDFTLSSLISTFLSVKNAGTEMFVITPQFVKQWDDTWDVVVNDRYHSKPVNYHLSADMFVESLPTSDLEVIESTIFKFAGGWVTLISKPLLARIGVPESFGHYGLEDTFVTSCSSIMVSKGIRVRQYIIKNLIAGENHKYRTNKTIKKFISSIDRKDQFRQIAHANFENEIRKFYSSLS